ncbi:hypothetical protein KUCAC02_004874, partial [Chaenocephalus aceratus]
NQGRVDRTEGQEGGGKSEAAEERQQAKNIWLSRKAVRLLREKERQECLYHALSVMRNGKRRIEGGWNTNGIDPYPGLKLLLSDLQIELRVSSNNEDPPVVTGHS